MKKIFQGVIFIVFFCLFFINSNIVSAQTTEKSSVERYGKITQEVEKMTLTSFKFFPVGKNETNVEKVTDPLFTAQSYPKIKFGMKLLSNWLVSEIVKINSINFSK